jgi:hypothetical protein
LLASDCKLTIVDIPVSVVELASPRGNVVSPVALILSTVWPYLDAKAMPYISAYSKLALVDSSVREDHFFPKFKAFFIE